MRVILLFLFFASTLYAMDDGFGPCQSETKGNRRVRRHDPYNYEPSDRSVFLDPQPTATKREGTPPLVELLSVSDVEGSNDGNNPPFPAQQTQIPQKSTNPWDLLTQAKFNNGSHEICAPLYQQALKLFTSKNNQEGIVSCHIGLGMNHQGIQHFDVAINMLTLWAESTEKNIQLAQCHLGRANVLRGREGGFNNRGALEELETALLYAKASKEDRLVIKIQNSMRTCRTFLPTQRPIQRR